MTETTTLTEQTPNGPLTTILPIADNESSTPVAGGGDWSDGLSSRTVERIAGAGMTSAAAVAAWLTANPYGTPEIGRVITSELRVWAFNNELIETLEVPSDAVEP